MRRAARPVGQVAKPHDKNFRNGVALGIAKEPRRKKNNLSSKTMKCGVVFWSCLVIWSSPTFGRNHDDFFPLLPPPEEVVSDEQRCGLDCKNGSFCAVGGQETDGHPVDPSTGGPLEYHETLDKDGWHCECLSGFTGLECEHSYETCNNGRHVCYNGGSCILPEAVLEDDKLYCDCRTAGVDPLDPSKRYAGKFCEKLVDISVEDCDRTSCHNDGSCKADYDPLQPCDCLEGFSGKYCEYVDDTVPKCSKECVNGGLCRLGNDGKATGTEFCECLPQHFGEFCEREAERCGDEFCYHGSKCFEILLADGSTEHICDCRNAFTEERYYAGEFCQYPSTQFCTGPGDLNGRQFCTNGGECPAEDHKPCGCPPGFSGPRCAFELGKDGNDYAACKLTCDNGGTCQKGVKDLRRAYGKFADDISHMLDTSHGDDFEHCVCPEGFFGIRCEYVAELCEAGEHICLHGSSCVRDGNDLGCDCDSAEQNTAGLFCEFFSTEDCNTSAGSENNELSSFCTNGGKCVEVGSGA